MFSIISGKKIWITCFSVDFRKGIDGLIAEAYKIGIDPFEGDFIIFISRDKTKAKILSCNEIYAQVINRRLHLGTYKIPFTDGKECRQINPAEISLFLEGHKYFMVKKTPSWPHKDS